jgi:hypothetical protein
LGLCSCELKSLVIAKVNNGCKLASNSSITKTPPSESTSNIGPEILNILFVPDDS